MGCLMSALLLCCQAIARGDTVAVNSAPTNAFSSRLARAPGWELFTNETVTRFEIDIKSDELEHLRLKPRSFALAVVRVGGIVYSNVGVRVKGSVGSFRPIDEKPALTLDFCRFFPDRKFHGLRRIHLNNSVEDPSFMNELLGSEIFRDAGIPAPRVSYALLALNSRKLGLYVLKEGFTEDFLGCYFNTISGDLYEPGTGYDVGSQLKRNSVRAVARGTEMLHKLELAARDQDVQMRWKRLNEVLDVDSFVTFMVTEVILGHKDGYCLARNNFRIYHDLDSGKMMFFPHGMDQLLGVANAPWEPVMSGIVAKAVMDTPEGHDLYEKRFRDLESRIFKGDQLTNRVDQALAVLRPALSRLEYDEIVNEATIVKDRIVQRKKSLEKQLSTPPLKPLVFSGGLASVKGWSVVDASPGLSAGEVTSQDGVDSLHFKTASETGASWRARILLPHGRYCFMGRAKVAGIRNLPYGRHQGAALRILGRERSGENFTVGEGWKELRQDFEVTTEKEELDVICELRASAGEVWFDKKSLKISQKQ